MELIQLTVFFNVAKYKSFTQTADNMFMSQSSVSKYVSSLENEIGQPLFVRSGKQIALTDFGREFYKQVKDVIDKANNLEDYVLAKQKDKTNKVVIGIEKSFVDSANSIRYNALTATIGMMNVRFPDISFLFKTAERSEIGYLIQSKSIDAGILILSDSEVMNDTIYNLHADILNKNYYYLAYPISNMGGKPYSNIVEIVPNIRTMSFVVNTAEYQITERIISEYHINPNLRPCDSTTEHYLKIISGETAGIIENTAEKFISACNIPVRSISLNSSTVSYSTYLLYNDYRIKSDDLLTDVLDYFKVHFKLNYKVDKLKFW